MIIVAWVLMLLQSISQCIKYVAIIKGRNEYHEVVGSESAMA